MKTLSYLALAAVLLAHPGTGAAQEKGEQSVESRTARQAIAQYPADIREAVCVVAGHPELLVKLARIQHQSSADFADLLDPYGRRDQEALWDLARFPGLIDKLADCDLQDEAEMDEVLAEYPAEIGVTARRRPEIGGGHFRRHRERSCHHSSPGPGHPHLRFRRDTAPLLMYWAATA